MTNVEICNNALDLIGQGLHISAMDENSKEAESCNRLFEPTLKRCLEKNDWSFARKTSWIDELAETNTQPFKYAYHLPSDCMKVLFIQPDEDEDVSIHTYEQDLRFDFRIVGDEKLLITSVSAPLWVQYEAEVSDLNLLPPAFTEWFEYCLAARLAADIIKGTEAIQISNALDTRGDKLLQDLIHRDPPPELPLDPITADVLALVGQGLHGAPLEVQRRAVGYTARKFKETLNRIIEQHPWSFARKSFEVRELGKGQDLYDGSYELPEDVLKLLCVIPDGEKRISTDRLFDFRVNGNKFMVTSVPPPFHVIYQGKIENYAIIKSSVMEATKLYVASDLILNFFKQRQTQTESTSNGLGNTDAQLLMEKADTLVENAWAEDEPIRLPIDERTACVSDICGLQIETQPLETQKRIADFVARYYPMVTEQALSSYNFSFATRDEYITEDYLEPDIHSLPWKYTYRIPDDVLRVLYLNDVQEDYRIETINYPHYVDFNFRNYMGKVYLVTDHKPNFVMRYQCKLDDDSLLPPLVRQALNYLCASQVITSFNTEQPAQSRNNADYFYQLGVLKLEQAAARDAQQGGYSIKQRTPSKFTRARF